MDPVAELKFDLPISLDREMEKALSAGETVLVSLPGSFGEALVITDRRALIIRERDTGSDFDVHSRSLTGVTGAEAKPSRTGGCFELALREAPQNPEHARVYFPTYEMKKFQAAADYLKALIASQPEPSEPAAPGSEARFPAKPACPQCSTLLSERDKFCPNCGRHILAICSTCYAGSPPGSEYCAWCGSKMVEFDPICDKCGGRVYWGSTFCTDCGSLIARRCAACGSMLVPGWRYCTGCGRELGSDKVDVGAARAMHSRLRDARESMTGSGEDSEIEPLTSPRTVSPAEQHNIRGREMFDSEQLESAITEFEEAVRLEPTNASYRCNLAVAYDEADRDEDALEEYTEALKLDPNDVTALLSLGYLYSEKEDIENAKATWSRILVIAPDSAEAQEARENIRNQEML
ncbi:MAG: hypothetical protein A2Z18_09850 [Armatimonadetes bacterium RBG_16_58_9]|nr:MAG: hypothetical protein A2Z18_09850 [Armatimonadetes bacterium RBG_16_58_9]